MQIPKYLSMEDIAWGDVSSAREASFGFFTGLGSASDSSVMSKSETRELSSVWGKVALSSVLGGRGMAGAGAAESSREVLPRSEEEEAEVGWSEEEEGGSITTSFRLSLIGETSKCEVKTRNPKKIVQPTFFSSELLSLRLRTGVEEALLAAIWA